MELGEPDASGRRRPVPIEGSETVLDIDMLISAISQQPDLDFLEKEAEKEAITTTRWNTFDNDPETLQCSLPYLFTGGDVATGPVSRGGRHRGRTPRGALHPPVPDGG
jgi:formate dehydrogenase beta subunit